jgi:RHS repeat-associated protein
MTGTEHYWLGSLAVGMLDASGQMYMRNRYYDPQTGQFTQPDPIDLAGGMNVYGFAAGDPVTYSDPYGLCAQGDTIPDIQRCTVAEDRAAGRRAFLVRESTDAAVPWHDDPVFMAVSGGPAGRGAGLLAGASRSLAARGVAALARRAGPGALVRIQAVGRIVGRLGLGQEAAGNLITSAMKRTDYEVGEDVMIGATRYLVSKTADRATSHTIAIAPDGSVANAVVRSAQGGGYEVVR